VTWFFEAVHELAGLLSLIALAIALFAYFEATRD
jgi:hypothetical protein